MAQSGHSSGHPGRTRAGHPWPPAPGRPPRPAAQQAGASGHRSGRSHGWGVVRAPWCFLRECGSVPGFESLGIVGCCPDQAGAGAPVHGDQQHCLGGVEDRGGPGPGRPGDEPGEPRRVTGPQAPGVQRCGGTGLHGRGQQHVDDRSGQGRHARASWDLLTAIDSSSGNVEPTIWVTSRCAEFAAGSASTSAPITSPSCWS